LQRYDHPQFGAAETGISTKTPVKLMLSLSHKCVHGKDSPTLFFNLALLIFPVTAAHLASTSAARVRRFVHSFARSLSIMVPIPIVHPQLQLPQQQQPRHLRHLQPILPSSLRQLRLRLCIYLYM
jgi:hypothetical protein